MAEINTVIAEASQDLQTIEDFVNLPAGSDVRPRLLPSVNVGTLAGTRQAIFEAGGLPATPFTTKALMTASALVDGDYAMVTDDSVAEDNGLYVKTAGAWVKSSYDPFGYANILARKLREESAGIISPEWERGSLSAFGGGKLDDSSYLSRVRLKEARKLAPNTKVTITSSDTDIGVAIVYWDKDNNFTSLFNYTQEKTVLVPYEYAVLARYYDLREIEDITEITSKIKISHVTQNDMKVETLGDELDVLERAVFGGEGELELVNGSLQAADGEVFNDPTSKARRLVSSTHKNKHRGGLNLNLITEGQKLKVYLYDETGKLIQTSPWYSSGTEVSVQVDGYFNPMVAWEDDTQPIMPADADLKISYAGIKSELAEDIQALNDLVLRGRYVPSWENGSYSGTGDKYYQYNRLRFATGKTPYKGEVIVVTTNPLQSVRVVTFKEDGSFIKYSNLAKKHEVLVDGYFDVLVTWDNNAAIQPLDAGVEITIGRGGSGSDSLVFDPSGMPRFSEVPFGHLLGETLLGETLPVLQTSFDNLVAGYHGTTTKTSIGFTTSGGHEMFAYELTPPDYVITIAITMHTHGNERWNPLGFYALLNEMQRGGNKHELIKWLKENVRWLVIPFASPTGVEKYTRAYDGANPNRNYDHLWDLWPSDKGTEVYSLNETQNIAGYFKPLRKEIDFHLDLHDIPGGDSYAYMPFGLPQTAYKKEQDAVKVYLGEINDAIVGGDYVMDGGSVTNFFSAVLAVPSITPEHVTQYWLNRGFTPDQQIAKALEQTCGFLYLFRYLHQQEDLRNSSYYSDKYEVAYSSKEFGIYSWSKAQLYTAILGAGFLTEDATQSNVFLNTGVIGAPTILVLSGSTEDNNNSDLTVLRVLQNIQNGDKMFINHLKNSNLVIAPAINANKPTLETVNEHVSALVAKYNPDYTVLVTAAGFEDAIGLTTGSSDKEASFTSMTKKSGVELTTEESALSDSLVGRYTIFSLQNEVVRHAAYPHTVAKWVGLVANDLASYYSEIKNN